MRTSGCRQIGELQISSSLPCPGEQLLQRTTWERAVQRLEARSRGRDERLQAYAAMLDDGTVDSAIAAIAAGRYRFRPIRRHLINRDQSGRRKAIYTAHPLDDLLLRALNLVLAPAVDPLLAPSCHSFRPGHGSLTALTDLVAAGAGVHAVHLDITDFFNSIDPEDCLRRLPGIVTDDPVIGPLLRAHLRRGTILAGDAEVAAPRIGVMAGTPLAPLISNLYLRDLDQRLADSPVTAARYSDDILVLGSPAEVSSAEALIRADIAGRGLAVNEAKTRRSAPGEAWEFLGFRCAGESIGLATTTMRKFRARLTRRVRWTLRHQQREPWPPEEVCRGLARWLNRKLYGVDSRGERDFSWAAWFFPVLTSTHELAELDGFAQQQIRFAASATRRNRNRRLVPYAMLRDSGYVPLVTAYHAGRRHDGDAVRERALRALERAG